MIAVPPVPTTPRLHGRGLIEATTKPMPGLARRIGFRDDADRGPIYLDRGA